MERLTVTVTVVGLLLIPGSLSICVLKEGTDSTCSYSSLLVVPHSQIDNGYSIIVDDLLNLTTNCSVKERSTKVIAMMGGAILKVDIIEQNSSSVRAKISVPADFGRAYGLHIISLSYHITDCSVQAELTDRLTLKVIDTPVLHRLQDTPAILQCQTKITTDDYWTEFVKDGIVLGYCGPYTTPIQYQNGMSIYYNSSYCTLKIDKFTNKHIGHYWCTTMVPYPDGNGFLNVNSTKIYLNNHSGHTDEDVIIGLGVGVGLTVVLVVILSIALAVMVRRYRDFCRLG